MRNFFMSKFFLKFSIFAVSCLLIGLVLLMGINMYVRISTARRIFEPDSIPEKSYDAAVVLGCGVYNNSQPSLLLRERLDAAINLYESGLAPKLIMSGDHGQKNYDEVNVMKKYAIDHGVPSEDIFMDHAGFSTYETIYRAREIFNVESMIIVTQQYHLYRALYLADAFDIQAYGARADKQVIQGQTARDFREILARNKDFVYSLLKPKPTFLGDPVSLDESGDLTND
jgi:vancomycin permeability regulator SanA